MRRGFGKIHTKKKHSKQNTIENVQRFRQNTYKKKHSRQNTMENTQRFRQNTYQKTAFWTKYNGEYVEVSAKYIPKKSILGKIQQRMRRGFDKIHTKKKHSVQNTMENTQRFRQNTYKTNKCRFTPRKLKIENIMNSCF